MAIMSAKLNIIFIEVPRTGSTSFRESLLQVDPEAKPILERHSTAFEVKQFMYDTLWNKLDSIAFVRNPKDWMDSVNAFPLIARIVENRTPYDWLVDDKGKLIVKHVYRTEDMNQIFKELNWPSIHTNRNDNKRIREPHIQDFGQFSRELKHYGN